MATTDFQFTASRLLFIFLLSSLTVRFAVADAEKDKEECSQQLVGMATCLPYVGGDAKAPTPDCCSGLKQMLKNNKKCLCVIIRDRDDPDLGLEINVTLALGLPAACHAPANVSQCPALLKLPPNSPEAQVFYQLGNSSSHAAAAPTSSSSSPASTTTTSPSTVQGTSHGSKIAPEKGGACSSRGRKWLPLETLLIGGLLLWFLVDSVTLCLGKLI